MEQQQIDSETQLLQDLRSGLYFKRRDAAIELGKLTRSNDDVAIALLVANESDTNDDVKIAVLAAIASPVHQQYIQDHPELIQKVKQATQFLQEQRTRAHGHESRVRAGKQLTLIGSILFGIGICIGLSTDSFLEYCPFCLGMLLIFAGFILSVIAGGSNKES